MPIKVSGVSVELGGRQIIRNVDVLFGAGVSAIQGPSGAGKSTLLAAISGQVPLASGSIESSSRGPIGWVFQSAPALLRRTVLDNVALGAMSVGASRATALAVAERTLSTLHIRHLSHQPVYRLSGGERQRVAIARELTRNLETILADEPTASLDADSRSVVCAALGGLGASGATVILATHDPFVSDLCDYRYVLEDGELRAA